MQGPRRGMGPKYREFPQGKLVMKLIEQSANEVRVMAKRALYLYTLYQGPSHLQGYR